MCSACGTRAHAAGMIIVTISGTRDIKSANPELGEMAIELPVHSRSNQRNKLGTSLQPLLRSWRLYVNLRGPTDPFLSKPSSEDKWHRSALPIILPTTGRIGALIH